MVSSVSIICGNAQVLLIKKKKKKKNRNRKLIEDEDEMNLRRIAYIWFKLHAQKGLQPL